MSGTAKYVWAALLVAVIVHLALVHAVPRVMMNTAIERIGGESFNTWRPAPRVTAESRSIPRPSPDFAYFACAYDLGDGPISIRVAPWPSYWSLSLYAANSDNFFVVDDRETDFDARVTLIRAGTRPPEDAPNLVESPSRRGIALIRRLAPDVASHAAANETARGDICAPMAPPA
ncbi:MAG: DUF1254 domain-containing protein [Hyphomonadaceae bacterium]|nr:DUF1254 domain-containing protein [Hyphomonadaceae bacterium]